MLDWPGRLSVTVFIAGCDLRCPFCHNPDLVDPGNADASSLMGLFEHLYSRRDWIDGVVVTGGEPTSDPDILDLLHAIHDMDMEIKFDTNGNNPRVLRKVLDSGLVSYVAMDVKATPEKYSQATGGRGSWSRAQESVELIRASGIDHEFRTTVFPDAVSEHDLPRIAQLLSGGNLYALQQFRPQVTLDHAATEVPPMHPDTLAACALRCSNHLPTVTRGV